MAVDFFAGCLGGCAGVIVGHPFDTVKVRLQTQSLSNPVYRGTIECFASIIKKESIFGLYKGMSSPLYGLAAINAIVFGVQGNVQRRLSNPDSLQSHALAGSIAGLAQSVICSPMELAKTRMQIQGQGESRKHFRKTPHDYKGPVSCLKKIYRVEGVKGVFRGFWLTVCRETPSFGAYFLSYEWLCRKLASEELQLEPDKMLPLLGLLFAGGVAGMSAWIVSYPIDVIKSKIQADHAHRYKGVVDCCRQSYAEGGLRVFATGLCSTMLRAFPVNAATFATVAWVLRAMRADQMDDDGSYELSAFTLHHHPPEAPTTLPVVPNFPSHP